MSIWFSNYKIEDLNNFSVNMDKYLGIEFIEIGPDFLKAKMPVDHRTKQPMGLLHGGASCVLAESTASFAAFLVVNPEEKVVVGINLTANHVKSTTDGSIHAKASPKHIGRSTSIWHVEITDDNNDLICDIQFTAMHKDKTQKP